jgi:hypothetical protein
MNDSLTVEKKQKLAEYIRIIELFLCNEIDALTFEKEFLRMFKNDSTIWQGEGFETLNQLFTDLDAFCADATLRSNGDLDEFQLREQSKIALQKLLRLSQM